MNAYLTLVSSESSGHADSCSMSHSGLPSTDVAPAVSTSHVPIESSCPQNQNFILTVGVPLSFSCFSGSTERTPSTFQNFGVAFESSGAFGKTALKVWDRLKYMAAEVGLDNYVVAGNPMTWSAFTFEQMVPQKVSWVIMRQNAKNRHHYLNSSEKKAKT